MEISRGLDNYILISSKKKYIKDSIKMETKKKEVENKKMDKAVQKNWPAKGKKSLCKK